MFLKEFVQSLYSRACAILDKLGLTDCNKEYILVMGLILGGSVTQPIHFDVAKSECNEDMYDEVMNLPNSPASLLLGFGESTQITVELGSIQELEKRGVERYGSVIGGVEGEQFLIIRQHNVVDQKGETKEEKEVVMLESKRGFLFKGDFCHAGSPVPKTAGVENRAWKKVHNILLPMIIDENKRNEGDYNAIFTKLCQVPFLDTITRFHVLICPKNVDFMIPDNAVGVDADDEKEQSDSCRKDANLEEPADDVTNKTTGSKGDCESENEDDGRESSDKDDNDDEGDSENETESEKGDETDDDIYSDL